MSYHNVSAIDACRLLAKAGPVVLLQVLHIFIFRGPERSSICQLPEFGHGQARLHLATLAKNTFPNGRRRLLNGGGDHKLVHGVVADAPGHPLCRRDDFTYSGQVCALGFNLGDVLGEVLELLPDRIERVDSATLERVGTAL